MDLVPDAFEVLLRQEAKQCVLATRGSLRLTIVHSHGQGRAIITTKGHASKQLAGGKILVHSTCGGSVSARDSYWRVELDVA